MEYVGNCGNDMTIAVHMKLRIPLSTCFLQLSSCGRPQSSRTGPYLSNKLMLALVTKYMQQ